MKTKTITTAKAELLVVDLPENAGWIKLTNHLLQYSFYYKKKKVSDSLLLPPGNWEPLGFLREVSEPEWMNIVNDLWIGGFGACYQDYSTKYEKPVQSYKFKTATESGLSLIKANVLLENLYQNDWDELCEWGHGDFSKDGKVSKELFDEAEAQVFRNPYLLVKA